MLRIMRLFVLLFVLSAAPASAVCIAGLGTCDPMRGQVLRGQVFWSEPSDSTWGAMIHFSESGRRCVAFGAVHWTGEQIDQNAKFCFEPEQAAISKSQVVRGIILDLQTRQQMKFETYYAANIDVVANTARFQYQECSRREGAVDFTCRPEWGLWIFKVNGDKCEVKVVEPWRPVVIDSSCEKFPE
jgi:hypothetical protein